MTTPNQNGDDHTPEEIAAANLTAYALGQLSGEELAAFEHSRKAVESDATERDVREIEALAESIAIARTFESLPQTSSALRERLEKHLAPEPKVERATRHAPSRRWAIVGWAVAACLLIGVIVLPAVQSRREAARRAQSNNHLKNFGLATQNYHDGFSISPQVSRIQGEFDGLKEVTDLQMEVTPRIIVQADTKYDFAYDAPQTVNEFVPQPYAPSLPPLSAPPGQEDKLSLGLSGEDQKGGQDKSGLVGDTVISERNFDINNPPKQWRALTRRGEETRLSELAAAKGTAANNAKVEAAEKAVEVSKAEYDQSVELRKKNPDAVSITQLRKDQFNYEKSVAQAKQAPNEKKIAGLTANAEQQSREADERGTPSLLSAQNAERRQFAEQNKLRQPINRRVNDTAEQKAKSDAAVEVAEKVVAGRRLYAYGDRKEDGEQYAPIFENPFFSPLQQPLSTFSIDVDTASYANTRRFLTSGRLPPPNAVRLEELVNYFRYDYPQPKDGQPFSANMEVAECPWREGHLVLRVGLKGKEVERAKRPASNLVFLLDVSGSMSDENKLPLLKTAMKLLVGELGENDRVSIVTYAGDAGLKLPSARGHEQKRINAAIDSLSAGGSTNGSAGIELAYEQAAAHFIAEGTNRVILCTDGDLNVGVTSDHALVKLIKQKAVGGVFLTVLGLGEGNLKDAKMEGLADNGNGLYAYIDSVREAKKVLVEQLTGSTITIAKDVKIQIEFNPTQITAYRLLGYENRVMAAQDFNNDKKDAGEIVLATPSPFFMN